MKSKEEIEKIRQVKILDLLKMQDRGRKEMINCPFHGDKTPSLLVDTNNSYHCFGCSKHGFNAIDFVMDLGCSFQEALKELEPYA